MVRTAESITLISQIGLMALFLILLLIFLSIVLLPVMAIGLIFSKKFRKNFKKMAIYYILLILLAIPPIVITNFFVGIEIGKTQDQAKGIITALDEYYKQVGRYPEIIDDLSPRYIRTLPKTSNGGDFSYYTYNDDKDYSLAFADYSFSGSYRYNTETKRWEWYD